MRGPEYDAPALSQPDGRPSRQKTAYTVRLRSHGADAVSGNVCYSTGTSVKSSLNADYPLARNFICADAEGWGGAVAAPVAELRPRPVPVDAAAGGLVVLAPDALGDPAIVVIALPTDVLASEIEQKLLDMCAWSPVRALRNAVGREHP